MNMTRHLSHQLDAQAEVFEEIFAGIDGVYDDEIDPPCDSTDQLYEAVLDVRVKRRLVLVLATGGPHVEAVAALGDDGSVSRARLIGCWGSERIEREVPSGGAVRRALESFAETTALAGESWPALGA